MAGGVNYRDPKTGTIVTEADPKRQAILEAGGYVRVKSDDPAKEAEAARVAALDAPAPPSTLAEHGVLNLEREKAEAARAEEAEKVAKANRPAGEREAPAPAAAPARDVDVKHVEVKPDSKDKL